MKYRALSLLIGLPALFLLAACNNISLPNEQERGILSTKMVNLSAAVDIYFTYTPGAAAASDADVLQKATRRDKRLLAPEFNPYVLKVQNQNPYAVLLLCSKDGKQAIMEDAGCSARLDRQVTRKAPCEFTLHVRQGCIVEGADAQ